MPMAVQRAAVKRLRFILLLLVLLQVTSSIVQVGSTQICATVNTSYLWNTGATTQCITVGAGDYTVTVTNANGCTSSCTAKVTERPNPICSITGNGSVCPGYTTQWCAGAAPVGLYLLVFMEHWLLLLSVLLLARQQEPIR